MAPEPAEDLFPSGEVLGVADLYAKSLPGRRRGYLKQPDGPPGYLARNIDYYASLGQLLDNLPFTTAQAWTTYLYLLC